jgi:WD40 repeat protein/energy-coupling factor transporter ATP-binding protein EcfA2
MSQERIVGNTQSTGDRNVFNTVQGNGNIITVTQQISREEVKTRPFRSISPYKGLKPFEDKDKDRFFGRDQFVAKLVDELGKSRLILLLGASGSGKSSVIRAGLIPTLRQEIYGDQFVDLTFKPNRNPFEGLCASLYPSVGTEAEMARQGDEETLIRIVKTLKLKESHWLIFIDQLEELFTTSLPEKQQAFIRALVRLNEFLCDRKDDSVQVIATMRSDFSDRLNQYPKLVKALKNQCLMLTDMQPEELRLAIEQPAAQHGVVFQSELVEEIIQDVQGQAGYLPLLQYMLDLLWQTELESGNLEDRTLDMDTYRQVGGARGALQQRVDQIYAALEPEAKLAAQRIFLKLVEIGGDEDSGTEWKAVRKRALRSEFEDTLENQVLKQLIDQNLLVSDAEIDADRDHLLPIQPATVEIAHEVLLTSWTTLRIWIAEHRQAIALRNRLNEDVARWQAHKHEDELWSGAKLARVQELRADKASTFNQVLGGFSTAANQFIDASVRVRERQRRRTMLGLTGFSVVALGLAGFAGWQWHQSVRQNIVALIETVDARVLSHQHFEATIAAIKAAKQSQMLGQSDMADEVSIALHHIINNRTPELHRMQGYKFDLSSDGKQLATLEIDGIVRVSDTHSGKEIARIEGHQESMDAIVLSPNGKQLITSEENGTVRSWDINSGKEIARLKVQQERQIVFSPDRKQLASIESNGTVCVWNVTSGKELARLEGHKGKVFTIIFSPDGKQLATSGADRTVRIWNTNSGKEIARLRGYQNPVFEIVFSRDSKQLATRGVETVRIWNVASRKEIARVRDAGFGYGMVFSPDGKRLATGGDGIAQVWNIATRREITRLKGHQGRINAIAFSPDGKRLATSGADGTARVWNATSGKEVAQLKGQQGTVDDIMFSPDGKRLTTNGADETVRVWDAEIDQYTAQLEGQQGLSDHLVFSPDGKRLATTGENGTALLWNTTSGKEIARLKGDVFAFSPDNKQLATSGGDETIRLWNATSGKEIAQLKGHQEPVMQLVFSSDGKRLTTGGVDGTVRSWEIASKKELARFKEHKESSSDMAFSPDGNRVVIGKPNGTMGVWDIATRKEIARLEGYQGSADSILFSPDSKWLTSRYTDKTPSIWDAASGKQVSQLEGHKRGVYEVVFSLDSKQVATARADRTARIWDAASGKEIAQLEGQRGSVFGIAFSPNGKRFAIGETDGTVRLWEIASRKEVARLRGHQGVVSKIMFSPDGNRLATIGDDLTTRLWQVGETGDLLAQSCNLVRSYLKNNSSVSPDDRTLCDDIKPGN